MKWYELHVLDPQYGGQDEEVLLDHHYGGQDEVVRATCIRSSIWRPG